MTARSAGASVARAALVVAVVTLAARVAGFLRTVVFSSSVGASPVGDTYQSVNALPNVVYEVAAGGALAALAVPLVAGGLADSRPDEAHRAASALLTWAVVTLLPLSVLLMAAAGPLSEVLLSDRAEPGSVALGADMLRIFAPQVVPYGVGVVLAGILQAHRRFFAAALAPLLSSVVVICAYLAYGYLEPDPVGAAQVSGRAVWVLAGGTTLGVVVLSLPLLIPIRRAGVRLRVTFRFPGGLARRARHLAIAGALALAAQQCAVALTLWLTHAPRTLDTGTVNAYAYIQAVYLLPYAVLAVPIATAAFPALAHAGTDDSAPAQSDTVRTLGLSLRAVIMVSALGAGVLMSVAEPVGAFFGALDRGAGGVGSMALQALPAGLIAYAPGVVGLSVGALLSRAIYARGSAISAGAALAAGWLIAALLPLIALPTGSRAHTTLSVLGTASTIGMLTSAVLLAVVVRRHWGADSLRGAGRTAGAAIVATACAVSVGHTLGMMLSADTAASAVLGGVLVAAIATGVYLAVMMLADRDTMSRLRQRGRARRKESAS